jgi:hypothetical protein
LAFENQLLNTIPREKFQEGKTQRDEQYDNIKDARAGVDGKIPLKSEAARSLNFGGEKGCPFMRVSPFAWCFTLALAACVSTASARISQTSAPAKLRSGPGPSFPAVASVPGHSRIKVLRCPKGWCAIAWQGLEGYLPRSIITSGAGPSFAASAPPARPMAPPPVSAAPYDVYYGAPVIDYGVEDGGFYGDGWYAGTFPGGYQGPGFWGNGGWAGPEFRGPGLWGRGALR